MTRKDAATAIKSLSEFTDRTETLVLDIGGVVVTAYWRHGGQQMFYTLADVRERIDTIRARRCSAVATGD